jgi:hypothetical protein
MPMAPERDVQVHLLPSLAPAEFLARHRTGDWGEVDARDRAANDQALREGSRLLSAYRTARGVGLWIITEADRSSTCLLLPEEY